MINIARRVAKTNLSLLRVHSVKTGHAPHSKTPFKGKNRRQRLYNCVKELRKDPVVRGYVDFEPNGRGTGFVCVLHDPPLPERPAASNSPQVTRTHHNSPILENPPGTT
jgi:hypothetical protein